MKWNEQQHEDDPGFSTDFTAVTAAMEAVLTADASLEWSYVRECIVDIKHRAIHCKLRLRGSVIHELIYRSGVISCFARYESVTQTMLHTWQFW